MATYAMMSGNTVSNVIVADDKAATEAALSCTLVEYTAENPAGIGWTLDEAGKFNPPVVVEQTEEDAKASAEAKLAALGLTAEEIAALTK
jgi:hypothetical protein